MRSVVPGLALAALALSLVAGCGPSSAPPMDVAASKLAIANVIQTFNRALAAGDSTGIDSLYAEDASVLPANAPRADGRAAIHRLWAGAMGAPGFRLVLTAGPITVARSGDLAAMTGRYQYAMLGPGNRPLRDTGKFVTVFAAEGGRWRILIDTWNGDAPPGPTGG